MRSSVLAPAVYPNVLICGSTHVAMAQISRFGQSFRRPVHVQATWDRLSAPARGTLVLYGVDRLDRDRQRELLAWLEAHRGSLQLVSISMQALYPLVQRGEFLDVLYYRLNMIYIDATRSAAREVPSARVS